MSFPKDPLPRDRVVIVTGGNAGKLVCIGMRISTYMVYNIKSKHKICKLQNNKRELFVSTPKSVRNRCVIEHFGGVLCCQFAFLKTVGIMASVTGLSQISSFFLVLETKDVILNLGQIHPLKYAKL